MEYGIGKDREVIVQARTVKDARLAAARLLRVDVDQLSVQVLDKGRRAFLGLFGRPAIIRASVRLRRGRTNRDLRADLHEQEGTIEVTGGILRVRGPRGRADAATIIPCPGAIVRVNGVTITGPRSIREDDEVDVELVEETRPARVDVEISRDGLVATVKVTPHIVVRHALVDQSAQTVLQLLTERHEERTKTVTVADVHAALAGKGVFVGIDDAEIARAVEASDGVARIVARGLPMREGRDGFVEYLFARQPVEIEYDEDEKADYWERYVFPSVKEGDVLAVVHPPVPGVPGRKVTGEVIPPPPVREATIRAKSGVKVSEDGRKAVAAIAGRPVLEGYREPYLKVVELMVHPGDVDLKSGNLRFAGDLLVLGNVTEGMHVSAYGDITVMGTISGAVVQAGGTLRCRRSVIGSHVRAGGLRAVYARLAPLLGDLDKVLAQIVQEVTRIVEHPANRRRLNRADVNRLVKVIVERHRQKLDAIACQYSSALDQADLPFPPALAALLSDICSLGQAPVSSAEPVADDLDALEDIRRRTEEVDHLLDAMPDCPGDVVCSYAQNSAIDAGGDIVVGRDGCFHSTLTSGRRVRVRGVFRGGEIIASGDVYVAEAGSPGPSAGRVRIRVSPASTVTIGAAHPDTVVQVGHRSYVFDKEETQVRVAMEPQGLLTVQGRQSSRRSGARPGTSNGPPHRAGSGSSRGSIETARPRGGPPSR